MNVILDFYLVRQLLIIASKSRQNTGLTHGGHEDHLAEKINCKQIVKNNLLSPFPGQMAQESPACPWLLSLGSLVKPKV